MSLNERERIHHQLLDALYTAKKQVEYLEAALAHNAAYLGTGVEREGKFGVKPEDMVAPDALIRYLELVEPEADISDYIGTEGVDSTRPRLGPDAPASIRPNKQPAVNPQVVNVAMGHPDDFLDFSFKSGALPPGTYLHTEDYGEKGDSPDAGQAVMGESVTVPVPPDGGGTPSSGRPIAPKSLKAGQHGAATPPTPMLVENVPTLGAPVRSAGPAASNRTLLPASLPPGIAPLSEQAAPSLAAKDLQPAPAPRPVTDEDCLRAHNAIQALNYGVWDWNMRTGNVFISSRWEELLGRPPANLPTAIDTLVCRLHPEDGAKLRKTLADIQNSPATSFSIPVRFSRKAGAGDGYAASGRIHAAYQRMGGKAVRLTAVLVEEEAAHEEGGDPGDSEYCKNFFSGMEEGFALFERRHKARDENSGGDDFRLLLTNEPFREMCALQRYQTEELPLEALTGDAAPEWRNSFLQVLDENRPVRMPLVNGLDNGLYAVSVFSPGPDRVACIAKNITESHRLEQEVHRNEARLAALYRLSRMDDYSEDRMVRYCLGEAVRLTGSEFGYVYVSPGPEDQQGHIYWSKDFSAGAGKEAETAGSSRTPWTGQPEKLLLRGPEVVNILEDVMARAFGGAVAVTRYMLVPIIEDGKVLCVAAVANKKNNYDASDQRQLDLFINGMWFHLRRRRAVRELMRAKEAAEAASLAKNEFLANISHELRTPLNGVLGMLQALQQSDLSREQMECVTTAAGSGRSLLRIISDILDFARMEGGDLELVSQAFDFPATVRSTLGLFAYEAKRRGLTFSYNVDEKIPRFLVGDESRVRQIFFNIVGNAMKFTPHGGVRVECELLPYKKGGKVCIYIAVHDSGIGISQEKLDMIFQAFTQLDGSSTRRYSGSGIGLAIVGRLVQLMDGSITVESEPGKGTTIHCSLSFEEAPQDIKGVEARAASPYDVHPLDILAVEDDSVNQFTLRTLLRKAGHTVTCVINGRQAVEALLLHPFQCVITDIQMPVMDGGEFVRRIREGKTDDIEPTEAVLDLLGVDKNLPVKRLPVPRDIPIVALTAHAMAGDRGRFLAMGLDYYLAKPLVASELEAVLSRISDHINAGHQQKQH